MKKTIALALLFLVGANLWADDANILKVKCLFPNVGDTIFVVDGQQKTSHVGKGGSFEFDIDLKEIKTLFIATPEALRGESRDYFAFPAVPGESVEFAGNDIKGALDIKGSKFYQDYGLINRDLETASKERDEFIADLERKQAAGANTDSLRKVFSDHYPALVEHVDSATLSVIAKYADSEAAAVAIQSLFSTESMQKGYDLLSPKVKSGRMNDYAYQPLKRAKEEKEQQETAEKKQAAGTEAPDFTLEDINGKPFTLSSLRGKYVLLDFWGSWCIWCIKGFPEMKKYYSKYQGKYEIVGVDCNDTVEKWKAAVKEHDLPWLHVYNKRGEGTVLQDYGIQGFPTKVLIGPDGKIVKTFVGEVPTFYTFLDELFGK